MVGGLKYVSFFFYLCSIETHYANKWYKEKGIYCIPYLNLIFELFVELRYVMIIPSEKLLFESVEV